jgi:hypothetical protein
MRVFVIVLAVVLGLIVLAIPIALLFVPPPPESWLIGVRDMSIIYASLFMCVGAILFGVMATALTYIALMVRDKIVPALEKVDETVTTVRGTTTFVSESVVAPIIKVAGAAAGARALVQTLMRREPPKPPSQNGRGG